MGTKNNPGDNDCYSRAMPDEPMFTLLGRDPAAPDCLRKWAKDRLDAIVKRLRPNSDMELVVEAMKCADDMDDWRIANDGVWRNPSLFQDRQ